MWSFCLKWWKIIFRILNTIWKTSVASEICLETKKWTTRGHRKCLAIEGITNFPNRPPRDTFIYKRIFFWVVKKTQISFCKLGFSFHPFEMSVFNKQKDKTNAQCGVILQPEFVIETFYESVWDCLESTSSHLHTVCEILPSKHVLQLLVRATLNWCMCVLLLLAHTQTSSYRWDSQLLPLLLSAESTT